MDMQVGHRAVEHLAQRLHGVDLGDRIRVEAELRNTLAAFPELDPGTIQQLHSMAGAVAPELAAGWHSTIGHLMEGDAPFDVREAMFAWKIEVQQEDWSKWAGTWKTASISPAIAYVREPELLKSIERRHLSDFDRDQKVLRHRFDLIIAEIDRVQSRDPLGRRRLLMGIEETLREPAPGIAKAIAESLAVIPSDPGFNVDGAAANRAEELLLDAVRAGLTKPSAGPDGPEREQMQERLFRLAIENQDPYSLDASQNRLQALLMWYLLPAYGSLTRRSELISTKGRQPPEHPHDPDDSYAYARNFDCLREMHAIDRAVNPRPY